MGHTDSTRMTHTDHQSVWIFVGNMPFFFATGHFFPAKLKKKPTPTIANTKNLLHKTIQSCNNIIIARNH